MSFVIRLIYGSKGSEAGMNVRAAVDFTRVLSHYSLNSRMIDVNAANEPDRVVELALLNTYESDGRGV